MLSEESSLMSPPMSTTEQEAAEGDSMGFTSQESFVEEPVPTPDLPPSVILIMPMAMPQPTSLPPCFEEDTRSSWNFEGQSQRTPSLNLIKENPLDDDSQNSFASSKSCSRKRQSDDEVAIAMLAKSLASAAETIFEYQWPPEKGEYYMLQEQVSEYLGIKSFRRKYPEFIRRNPEVDERVFLKEKGVVTETQCDLGLISLRSEDVLELMSKEYPEKYANFIKTANEKERQSISEKHKGYTTANVEKGKMADFLKKAIKSASAYNQKLNDERKTERQCCFDLQTYTIQYPTGPMKKLPPEATKVGKYPVSLMPGQYQDGYSKYTPDELKYLPITTVLYGPFKELNKLFADPCTDGTSDSDDSCSDDSCCSSSQGTAEGSGDCSSASETGPQSNGAKDTQSAKKLKTNLACKVCQGGTDKNKEGKPEDLVKCANCESSAHPSCIEMSDIMVPVVRTYAWQCMDCKTCMLCMDPYDEDKMLFCDKCDRGYHTFCVGLKSLPSGRWLCRLCAQCEMCNANQPGTKASKAQWHQEIVRIPSARGDSVRRLQILCAACKDKK